MDFFSYQPLIILVIFAIASIFHGLTGIGVTLIATTALASFYPMPHVLVLTVLPCLVINLVVFLEGGRIGYFLKKYWLLGLTSFVGSFLGAKLVYLISQHYLLISLGLLIILYVSMHFIGNKFGKTIALPNNLLTLLICGTVAGVLGGATNAMSPLLVMYLLPATANADNPKIELIKASNLCYLIGKIAQLIVLAPALIKLSTIDLWVNGITTVLAVACLFIGFYFRHKISQTTFKNLTLLILLMLGIKALINGLNI